VRGDFWTPAEWADWSDRLAELIPEDDAATYSNPEGAQESIIEDCLRAYAARLAAVEALLAEWEAEDPGMPLDLARLRAVVAADPAEWSCRDCGATGSLSDSVSHRCVVAAVVADPADTAR
jgi:hypothetical protein